MAAIKKRKTRLLLAAMEAFVDLKSESVAQTRSEKYDDSAHLKTVVTPTCRPIAKVVRSSDRKPLAVAPTRAAVSRPNSSELISKRSAQRM